MTSVKVLKFARNLSQQANPNLTKREKWSNLANAVGKTDLYATSHYTTKEVSYKTDSGKKKTKLVDNYPYKLSAYDFGFNIPSNAYITKIKIGVRMKSSSLMGTNFPSVGFYIKDKKSNVTDSKKADGWHNGIYWKDSDDYTSNKLFTEEYVMSESVYHDGGFSVSDLNSSYFGVDLNFAEDTVIPETVYLKWVWCEITYEIPNYILTHTGTNTTESNPRQLSTGYNSFKYRLQQPSKANGGGQTFALTLPFGTETDTAHLSTTKGSISATEDPQVFNWTLNCSAKTDAYLSVDFIDYTVNKQRIKLEGVASKDFWFESKMGVFEDYEQIILSHMNEDGLAPHKGHKTCFNVSSVCASANDTLTLHLYHDKAYALINTFNLNNGECDSSVSINSTTVSEVETSCVPIEYESGKYYYLHYIPAESTVDIEFNVPICEDEERFKLGFHFCIIPLDTGSTFISVYGNDTDSLTYNVADPYEYHLGATDNETDTEYHQLFLTEQVKFTNHRIASTLETGAYVLHCTARDEDALMIEMKPSIHMYKWEQLDYIGCVPLEHLHFDPKSTYKDKLIDSRYKNKRYMGKQLASDEDIDLNVRLHPAQVTTIQGLIDMDKPIPINANHLCFEGDALNHRGWAEIYGIKAELTNPHWYKCEIDVKYLTHNLNTRFHINKGDKTFSQYTIPTLVSEVTESGDAIGTDEDNDYFVVETDGAYAYIDDEYEYVDFYDENGDTLTWNGDATILDVGEVRYTGNDILLYLDGMNITYQTPVVGETLKVLEYFNLDKKQKNQFSLEEGQHFTIRSREKLPSINQITIDWMSSILAEDNQNAVSRIIRLVDGDGNSVFEYEYTDFDFDDYFNSTTVIDDETVASVSYISCRVIGRVRDRADFIEVINQEIDLPLDVEDETLNYFGSTVSFMLNGKTVAVKDEGYSGSEIETTVENLEDEGYYYECYWRNNNTDAESDDIVAYIDIVAQDDIFHTKLATKYDKLYVSPFPVVGKNILFTRNAEEGVIYYLDDDSKEFTYLIEPYYQYHNGVDLRNDSKASIFNLNYGYKVIYLENGLVSLAINRLTGAMTLAKWDDTIKQYVDLFDLSLNKYEDININSISDDRIELQASDSTIIMYRGHPYVIFKHELEDINLDTTFHKVWGTKVDGEPSDYPKIYDLMNTNNLLPTCVTSKLDDDCVTLSESTVSGLTPLDIKITHSGDAIYEDEATTFTITNAPNGDVYYLIDKDGDDKTGYEVIDKTNTGSFPYTFTESGVYNLIAVYVGDDTFEYSVSDPLTVTVIEVPNTLPDDEEEQEENAGVVANGTYNLSMSCPSKMSYRDGSKIIFTLTRGGTPVNGVEIQVVDFNHINTATTGDPEKGWADGQVVITNHYADSHPKTYTIGARYYVNGHLKKKVFKDVKVVKGEAEFELNHKASTVGNTFSVKLKDANTGAVIPNRDIIIKVDKVKYERKTNDNGNEAIKIKTKGTHTYKCSFKGDKDYKKCKFKYREYVRNG